MENGESSSEEYREEARDAVRDLKSREITRTRSMSPNHFSKRRVRKVIQRSKLLENAQEESDEDENSRPSHLEDLPSLELEGAPPGWENHRRARNPSQKETIPPPAIGRRSSAFPSSGATGLGLPRGSVSNQRRASQMTHDEWCELKRFQEIHEAAKNQRRDSKDINTEHDKNMQHNISYEAWKRATEERNKQGIMKQEELKMREEEEREAADKSKYKRRMSFDQWNLVKSAMKVGALKNNASPKTKENEEDEEERKKKAEDAHRKWLIKKEMEEIRKDRDMMLRMQNASLTAVDPSANASRGRRTSWVDADATLQVKTKRKKGKS